MEKIKHVIIDGRMITKELHGIARYTYELINRGSISNKIRYSVLTNDIKNTREIFNNNKEIRFIQMRSKFLSIGEQIELPYIINKYKNTAIFHSPSFVSSPLIKTKMVMTVHDLNHIKFSQFYSRFHKFYYKYIVKPSAKKSERIITVSNFSKKEIIEWLNYSSENKIIVTYNGIDEKFKEIKDKKLQDEIKIKYNLPEKYILYIGNLKQHKNVETLIKSIKYLKNDNIKLVINGKKNKRIQKIIEQYHLINRIRFIGYVDDDDLPTIYSIAKVFVFPSLYEGFGLPPLEAMACGCPTIVSNMASLPEVVGNEGWTFSPKDFKELAYKINILLDNKELYTKQMEYGKQQALNYTWENLVNISLKLYEEIY
ncbi:MAG: glycosyltransferase family 4 protein [Eubacteriaceae bacterium]